MTSTTVTETITLSVADGGEALAPANVAKFREKSSKGGKAERYDDDDDDKIVLPVKRSLKKEGRKKTAHLSSSSKKKEKETDVSSTPLNGAGVVSEKKKYRRHAGTVTLMNIRREQKSIKNSFRRAPYARLVRTLAREIRPEQTRFTRGALDALQQYGENCVVSDLSWANLLTTICGRRKTLMPSDIHVVEAFMRGKPPMLWGQDEIRAFEQTVREDDEMKRTQSPPP